jgi:hypothetical protein
VNKSKDERTGFDVATLKNIDGETRKALNAAFDAMSEWRDEMTASTERYSNRVFEKMGAAARALGWPDEIITTTKEQMLQASRLQSQMIDQVMDAWQAQLKSSNPFELQHSVLSQMTGSSMFPGMMPGLGMDMSKGLAGMSTLATTPVQFWMQTAEMWQRSWAQAMQLWMSSINQAQSVATRGVKSTW